MTFPSVATAVGAALPPFRPTAEARAPQTSPHRGTAPEDFDIRAVRQILDEATALEDDRTADPLTPVFRETRQSGSIWRANRHMKALALHGITGTGYKDNDAAEDWLAQARRRCTLRGL